MVGIEAIVSDRWEKVNDDIWRAEYARSVKKAFILMSLLCCADLPAADKIPLRIQAIAQMLTATQRMKLLDLLNKGRDDSLRSLPGVGETRLEAIKKARPFNDITEVTRVPGVGEGTFIDLVKHAKAGFPKKPAK